MTHVTARMAWHDSGWNGKVCKNPDLNSYCTGSYSLLSNRLAREKCSEIERKIKGEKLDSKLPEYIPPCFWSSCAYSQDETKVVHGHPFLQYRDSHQIEETLRPKSVFTWPFRLSMTQNPDHPDGKYFANLNSRIQNFCDRLTPEKSLVFFYLNYDNPVSADEYRYALVGCARLSHVEPSSHYEFSTEVLDTIRDGDGMQHFPTQNWAIQLSHQGDAVRLPYQEYLSQISTNPHDERKLEDIKVLIEEPALLPSFKYVSEQINDDQALTLLYKLRRAFKEVQKHGIVSGAEDSLSKIERYIEELWESRGLYPGLGSVVSVLSDLAGGDTRKDNFEDYEGDEIVEAIHTSDIDGDLLDLTFNILKGSRQLPKTILKYESTILDARDGAESYSQLIPTLKKLSLFALTPRQIARILFPSSSDGLYTFGNNTTINHSDVAENPYLLAENYVPATDRKNEMIEDLDREQRTDGPVDYSTIDIGMFPDSTYLERNRLYQNLQIAGPERLRAFAIEALRRNESLGHSFAPLKVLVREAETHPLVHRNKFQVTPDQFLTESHKAHFKRCIDIVEKDNNFFFYMRETKKAEEIIGEFVCNRLKLENLSVDFDWIDGHLDSEANQIAQIIDDFKTKEFLTERRRMMKGALERPFFCVTGRPGSGKTRALRDLLDYFSKIGESTTVLTPTGKSSLRLNEGRSENSTWRAQTIDHWIYRSGLSGYLTGERSLSTMERSQSYEESENFVVDEMSMVDLYHLALLFRALDVHQSNRVKRVILVGDENQLPPINCGRPFHDIIEFLRENSHHEEHNLVRLTTNCRQQYDSEILHAAHLFVGNNRYHTDLYNKLLKGGEITDSLHVRYWASHEELQEWIKTYIDDTAKNPNSTSSQQSREQLLNLLYGLYDKGYVPGNDASNLSLDRVQLLTPYRSGFSGALGLSNFVRTKYRHDAWPEQDYDSVFAHSDKIIRTSNYYKWNYQNSELELYLSNGSIGMLCNHQYGRRAYFTEADRALNWEKVKEEDFELAYGITVHKAQGSEFTEVLVVIPERQALLSRELIYTALTRSKTKLILLVQHAEHSTNPLQIARERSVLLVRNSSIFSKPFDSRLIYEPEQGVRVKSKIEYLIYRELKEARDAGRLTFTYESPIELQINGRAIPIKPDFTVVCNGRTFFWEHLGMLDRTDYSQLWNSRFGGYKETGYADNLITTDDLGGVRQDRLREVVDAIVSGSLGGEDKPGVSSHHHRL